MTSKILAAACAVGLCTSTVLAGGIAVTPNVQLNELYISHSGTDDMEYIELSGPAGESLDGVLVVVVEGDGTNAGTVDRVWNLDGLSVPTTGFFVLGDTAVTPNDFDIGGDNRIENGTDTFYLVHTLTPSIIEALDGTDVDPEDDGTTTIPTLATVVDIIAATDGDAGDTTYDGAQVIGPDGSFLPAGIFRAEDTNDWCETFFLDFDDVDNLTKMRTPGDTNVHCVPYPFTTVCDGKEGTGGLVPELTGVGELFPGFDTSLVLTDALPSTTSTLVAGVNNISAPFKGGTLCPSPDFLIPQSVDGTGSATLTFTWPDGTPAGVVFYLQHVVDDPGATFGLSMSNGLEATSN